MHAVAVGVAVLIPYGVEYEFVWNLSRPVAVELAGVLRVGYLNRDGSLEVVNSYKSGSYHGGRVGYELLNVRAATPRAVMELRGSELYVGVMGSDGKFLPEEGVKPIPFGRFRYTPYAPVIWNLPGWFKPAKRNSPASRTGGEVARVPD